MAADQDQLEHAIEETVRATVLAFKALASSSAGAGNTTEQINPDHARIILEHAPAVLAELRQLLRPTAKEAVKSVRSKIR